MEEALLTSKIKGIIEQYHIRVKDESKFTTLDKVMMRSQENYRMFHNYKEGRFFDRLINGDPELKQRKMVIEKAKADLEKDIE